jgi:hypothetical protein
MFHAIRRVTNNQSMREKNDHRIPMESMRGLHGDWARDRFPRGMGRSFTNRPKCYELRTVATTAGQEIQVWPSAEM